MTDPLFDIAGKVALVTGGTSGIGEMIARGLVARGVKTYITGRDAAKTRTAATEITQEIAESAKAGGTCIGLACDLEDPEAPARLGEELAKLESRLDILVNNAGTSGPGGLEVMKPAEFDKVMGVNTRAPFFLVQALLPLLKAAASAQSPARVISISSIGGLHVPNWEAHAYGASKAAINHLTRSLAKSLGASKITVNAIAPGPFPSRMTNVESDAVKKAVATYIPLGRPGEADDVVGVVAFLASRAGAYVNGLTIPLEGGYIAAL